MPSFIYDTHVHTAETSPCGKVDAAGLVGLYKQAGYEGIVITDHYFDGYFLMMPFRKWETKIDTFLTGFKNALREGKKSGLTVLLGMEIRFTDSPNDYLVYGIDEEFLKKNKKLYKLGLREFRKLTVKKDIIIIQAHPFRPGMKPANPLLIDGIEVHNGNPRQNSGNHLALEYAEKNNMKMTSGSDFHQKQDLARGGIIVNEPIYTADGLVKIIREDRIVELVRV